MSNTTSVTVIVGDGGTGQTANNGRGTGQTASNGMTKIYIIIASPFVLQVTIKILTVLYKLTLF